MSRKSSLHEGKKKEEKMSKLEMNIVEILSQISSQNANVEYNPDDPFSKKTASNVTLQHYFHRIKKYGKIEKSTLIIILIYADRICTTSGIILNPHNIHKIILGCLLLAIKYNEDVYFTNEHYAKVGGVSIEELNNLEYFSIQLLNFDLFISEDIYKKYLNYISSYSIEQK